MANPFANETELKILTLLHDNQAFYAMQIVRGTGLKQGTIYTTLQRMMDKGLVSSRKHAPSGHPGMPRPLYKITDLGGRMLAAWSAVNQTGKQS